MARQSKTRRDINPVKSSTQLILINLLCGFFLNCHIKNIRETEREIINMKDDVTKRRFEDLAEKSYRYNQYTFTSFLTESELSEFFEIKVLPSDYTISGGRDDADRVMIRFGNPEEFGYEENFPISCLKVSPVSKKFADDLSHRDFLGAIMNLGINRSEIGDIVVDDKAAYVFCTDKMADYLCGAIECVKHTTVTVRKTDDIPESLSVKLAPGEVQVASERIDGVISKICHVSRGNCVELFSTKKIFVNGKCMENNSYLLKEGDKVSVRGFGKFRFTGISGTTRKGNKIAGYEKYV